MEHWRIFFPPVIILHEVQGGSFFHQSQKNPKHFPKDQKRPKLKLDLNSVGHLAESPIFSSFLGNAGRFYVPRPKEMVIIPQMVLLLFPLFIHRREGFFPLENVSKASLLPPLILMHNVPHQFLFAYTPASFPYGLFKTKIAVHTILKVIYCPKSNFWLVLWIFTLK